MKRWKDWPALRSPKGILRNPQPKRHNHRRRVYVSLLDWYLIEALPQIQLAENDAAIQPGGEVLDVRQGVGVWRSGEVQPAVIAAGPPCPVRLHHHV